MNQVKNKMDYIWKCTHCHTPLLNSFKREQTVKDIEFCCPGCKSVYDFLSAYEADDYYRIKSASEFFKPASPVLHKNSSFAYLEELPPSIRMTFYVEGMHCAACLWLLEHLDQFSQDIHHSLVDFGKSTVTVFLHHPGTFQKVAELLEKLGYPPHALTGSEKEEELRQKETRRMLFRIGISGACAGNIMLFSVSVYAGISETWSGLFHWISFLLVLPVASYCAFPFYQAAWHSVKNKKITIDLPVTLAVFVGTLWSAINLLKGSSQLYLKARCDFVSNRESKICCCGH